MLVLAIQDEVLERPKQKNTGSPPRKTLMARGNSRRCLLQTSAERSRAELSTFPFVGSSGERIYFSHGTESILQVEV